MQVQYTVPYFAIEQALETRHNVHGVIVTGRVEKYNTIVQILVRNAKKVTLCALKKKPVFFKDPVFDVHKK